MRGGRSGNTPKTMDELEEEELLILQKEEEELLMLESADLMFEEDILDEEEELLMLESDFSLLGEDASSSYNEEKEEDSISFLEADTYEHILEVDLKNSMIDAEAHDEFDYHDEDFSSTNHGHKYKNDFDEAEGDEYDAGETGQRRMNTDTSQSISAPDKYSTEYSVSIPYSPDYSNTFYIRNKGTGKYLDVAGGYCHNGNNIHLWEFNGSQAQQFYWHRSNNGKTYLINAGCQKAVDIAAGQCGNRANIHLWSYWGGSNQEWLSKPDGTLYNPGCRTAVAIDNSYYQSYNGNNIMSNQVDFTLAQQWEIEPVRFIGQPW